MNKEEYRKAFDAGKEYWSWVQIDEPMLYKPIDFDEWYDTVVIKTVCENKNCLYDQDRQGMCNYCGTKQGARCQCPFCKIYPYEKWATIMECGCGCHTGDGMTGHDGLCCALPNILKKNNPYKNLEKAEVYRKRINELNLII